MTKKGVSKDLLEFGLLINQSTNLSFVLDKIIEEKSLSLLSAKRSTLYLLDDMAEYLIPMVSIDPNYKKESLKEFVPVRSSLSGKVVSTKKGMIFNNASKNPAAHKIPGTPDTDDEHLMVLPLLDQGFVFGTINFYRDHDPYTEQDLDLAHIFSMYASVAIRNAMTNEQLKQEILVRKESEKKFRSFFNDSMVGTFISTSLGVLIDCNQSFVEMMGFPNKDTALSVNTKTLYEKSVNRKKKIEQLKKYEKILQYEEELIKYDGEKITVLSNIWGEYNDNGELLFIQGFTQDITEKKILEKEVIASEQKYKNVIEHSNQMFYIHDDKHVLSYVSPQSVKLFGYTPQEMMVEWTSLVTDNPINLEGLKITEETLKSGKISEPYFLEIKRKDGQYRLVKVFESPLKDENGKIIGLAGSLEDVTEFKKYENELIEKNEKLELFATIFENLNECITVTDKDHKIFYVNNAFKKLYGYKEEEYIGKTVDFLRIGNDPELLKEIKKATNNGGWSGEIINRKKDGTVFPIELSTTRIFNKEKNIIARIGIVRDITERKKIESELKDEQEKYRALVENSTDAIYMLDSDGTVLFANSYGAKLLNKKVEDIIGKNISRLFPKEIAINQKKSIDKVFSSGEIAQVESKIDFPKGTMWLDNVLIPIFDKNEQVVNCLGVSRNISQKKEYELELEEHRTNLEKLVKERTEELEEKNKILDSSVKVFVGREQTIIKLNNKIKELESELEAAS